MQRLSRRLSCVFCLFFTFAVLSGVAQDSLSVDLSGRKADGYKGIWFTLGQFYAYGDKYSGGLGTYTAKHIPLAIYAPEVNKTFFVYGGDMGKKQGRLLCMIGCYDHERNMVAKPTIVHDKMGVDDPHDNPSLLIDKDGYLWVFVSGRGQRRPGFKYRSTKPYDIEEFERISEEEMTYPQPWYIEGSGYFHFFTKYTGVRELYFETSLDGRTWSEDQKLAGIVGAPGERAGHYQVSNHSGPKLSTFFNRHPDGNVDRRTNLYYLQTVNFGRTWTAADGSVVELPVTEVHSAALVRDYESEGKNVYLKDLAYDAEGNPVCLYLTSGGHEPGPANGPREWRVSHWIDGGWRTSVIASSDHNYDMGSLWIDGQNWLVVAPIGNSPQLHGGGGEVQMWTSADNGQTWSGPKPVTRDSKYNNNYVRRVVNGRDPFRYFWADGHPGKKTKSQLYFGDTAGQVWKLPYKMRKDWERVRSIRKRPAP